MNWQVTLVMVTWKKAILHFLNWEARMAFDSPVYRVLIASPSDVLEERDAAVRVMQEWNNLYSGARHVVVLPLRWETHTAPEYNVRPQEAINRQIVDDCDLVVGIFWTKLGTPTGEADSGTLEEIERVAKAGKPAMLYFSSVPMDPNKVDTEQLDRLRDFKQKVYLHALVDKFSTALEFRDKFNNQLELKIRELQKADGAGQPLPLELHFVSPDRELLGSSWSTGMHMLELSEAEPVDGDLGKYFASAFHKACLDAALVPIALAIKNTGSTGIRNLYVEVSVTPEEGEFELATETARQLATMWGGLTLTSFTRTSEPSEVERKLEKLSVTGLAKEGNGWKFSFEWDALQPQRIRLVQPFLFLQASGACKAKVSAKVYADSFADPITLEAAITVAAKRGIIQHADVLAKARQLMEEDKRNLTTTTISGG